MELPVVGRRMTDTIMQLRKAHINITVYMFKSLGIKDYKGLLDSIDFASWTDPFDNEESCELSGAAIRLVPNRAPGSMRICSHPKIDNARNSRKGKNKSCSSRKCDLQNISCRDSL